MLVKGPVIAPGLTAVPTNVVHATRQHPNVTVQNGRIWAKTVVAPYALRKTVDKLLLVYIVVVEHVQQHVISRIEISRKFMARDNTRVHISREFYYTYLICF